MSTVEDMASAAKLAYWDLNKAAYQAARGTYKRAQNAGMRYQNWRHKGAGNSDGQDVQSQRWAGAEATMVNPTATPGKSSRKQWTTDEESFSNTTTSHTTYTRKRTR